MLKTVIFLAALHTFGAFFLGPRDYKKIFKMASNAHKPDPFFHKTTFHKPTIHKEHGHHKCEYVVKHYHYYDAAHPSYHGHDVPHHHHHHSPNDYYNKIYHDDSYQAPIGHSVDYEEAPYHVGYHSRELENNRESLNNQQHAINRQSETDQRQIYREREFSPQRAIKNQVDQNPKINQDLAHQRGFVREGEFDQREFNQREIDRQREVERRREIDQRREIDRQREIDRRREIDRQRETARQREIDQQREIHRQRELDRQREINLNLGEQRETNHRPPSGQQRGSDGGYSCTKCGQNTRTFQKDRSRTGTYVFPPLSTPLNQGYPKATSGRFIDPDYKEKQKNYKADSNVSKFETGGHENKAITDSKQRDYIRGVLKVVENDRNLSSSKQRERYVTPSESEVAKESDQFDEEYVQYIAEFYPQVKLHLPSY